MRLTQFFGLAALPLFISSAAPTDETQAADPPQSGYLPNHNIGPNQVAKWVKLSNVNYNIPGESFYGTPLVYTPPTGFKNELVIIVSDQNIVRVVDGVTSTLYQSRTLDPPFSALDANCNNDGSIGITGTPFIDPATGIMYFYAKSYTNGKVGPQGTLAGVYKLWALQLPNLTDVPGFPVAVTGPTDNDKTRYFVGGTLMQRPGLTMIGDSLIAGFGGHCDGMNFTGMLVTVSKTPGKGVTSIYAMEAAPGAPPQSSDWMNAKGGKAGIWQSGMGIATDLATNRVFFATGNSDSAGDLGGPTGAPRSGKIPISTLGQAIVSMSVDPVTGVISPLDYFVPANYASLNTGDKDISSSGVSLLDPVVFSGGGVNRVAICASKAGYVFVMDADNLGGFKMGPSGTDGILQTLFFSGTSFYNGIGSYPGEGGWVYMCSSSSALQAYKLVFNSNGQPNFQYVAQTALTHGCHGSPTVTSLNGQPGTAIVWMADTTKGLVGYNAVPDPGSSVLTPITLPGSGGLTKFHRPTFGNNRVYVTTGDSLVFIGGVPGDMGAAPSSSSSSIGSSSKPPVSSSTSSSSIRVSTSSFSSSTTKVSSSSTFSLSTSTTLSTIKTGSSSSLKSTSAKTSTTSPIATPTGKPAKPPKPVTRTYQWSLGWVNTSPDGFKRPMVGINGQWPCPPITANLGDTIKINLVNNLGNETTSIHFHGLYQFGANSQDGPAMVTQCPIPPGSSFVYEFKIQQNGTYWYHAHVGGQYLDGLRGPIIISDFYAPFTFDKQYTMTLTDHYHTEAPALINYYQSPDNYNSYGGTEPVPDSTLINEQQGAQFPVQAGKTYLFNIISMAGFAAHWVQFNQHTMTVVEIDGVYTVPYPTQQLYVTPAQRFTVLVTANADPSANYGIISQMNTQMFDTNKFPQDGSYVSFNTAYMVYNAAASLPASTPLDSNGWALVPQLFDDALMVPRDGVPLYVNAQGAADLSLDISTGFGPDDAGQFRGFFGAISYVPPKVPTLYTLRDADASLVNNPTIYGTYTHPIVLPFNSVIELSIYNHDTQPHPFHLHGHNFQVLNRAGDGGVFFPDSPDKSTPGSIPMRRDTILVHPSGATTIRFIANNPGIWLFHCHNEWHVEAGLTLTFIEAPTQLKAQGLYIPTSHKDVCAAEGIAMKGNAAGNKKNFLDLTGENTTPPLQNWGALVNPPS